jgi:phosphomevalonate kinase
MTVRLRLSAPGKLVLLGEYAVLFGAPAAIMSVNRRAQVELAAAEGPSWSVRAPGVCSEATRFELEPDGRVRWAAPLDGSAARLPLVEGIVRAMVTAGMLDAEAVRPADLILDTRAFFRGEPPRTVKLGLGSSAAVTVAFASGLAWWSGRDDLVAYKTAWLNALVALHRTLQGGRGSGLDVAASLLGGGVEFRVDPTRSVATADVLAIPEGLHLVFLWTGRAADTSSFLEQLDHRMEADGGSVSSALERLAELAHSGVTALRSGHVEAVLDAVDAYCDALERLGRDARLPILSDDHLELRRLARRHGARYKPSGAGGGDLGIAWSGDPAAAAETASAATAAGFQVLDLHLDRDGLRRAGSR